MSFLKLDADQINHYRRNPEVYVDDLIEELRAAYAEIDRLEGVLAARRENTRKASEVYRAKNLEKVRAIKREWARTHRRDGSAK